CTAPRIGLGALTDGGVEFHDAFDGLLHHVVAGGKGNADELIAVYRVEIHAGDECDVSVFQYGSSVVNSITEVLQDRLGWLCIKVECAIGRCGIAPAQSVHIFQKELSGASKFGDLSIGFSIGFVAECFDSSVLACCWWT